MLCCVIVVLASLDLIRRFVRAITAMLMKGLIPIIGPIWANSLSGRVIRMAEEAEIPATLVAQMTANITFDFIVALL